MHGTPCRKADDSSSRHRTPTSIKNIAASYVCAARTYVLLSVSDTGMGWTRQPSSAFSSPFHYKEVGKGTGWLGNRVWHRQAARWLSMSTANLERNNISVYLRAIVVPRNRPNRRAMNGPEGHRDRVVSRGSRRTSRVGQRDLGGPRIQSNPRGKWDRGGRSFKRDSARIDVVVVDVVMPE